jgi:DnaK suppressor protein
MSPHETAAAVETPFRSEVVEWYRQAVRQPGLALVDRYPLERFRVRLEESLRDLSASARRARAAAASGIDTDELADDMDLAAAAHAQELRVQLLDREKHAADELQSALDRIEDGTFGICEGCGGDISWKRLEAHPTTSLCIHCQEDDERGGGRSPR